MDILNLSQIVTSWCNKSLIDLVLTSLPSHILECNTIPPLANSDHHGLSITISMKITPHQSHSPRRTVWRYSHADFAKASRMIPETNWDPLASEDVDQYCTRWQTTFLTIMDQCIPKKVLPPKKCNLPWLTKSLVQSMRRRNNLFKRAKRASCPSLKAQYKHARNKVTSQLCHAKGKFFSNLDPSNTKQFWKTVKTLI